VLDQAGRAGAHPLTGFFFRQTRFLRELRFEIEGEAPFPCSIAEVAPDLLETTGIFPEVERGGGGGSGSGGLAARNGVLYRTIDAFTRFRVYPASVEVRVRLTNRWQESLEAGVAWVLSADFASVDEAQFGYRAQTAVVEPISVPDGVVFRYCHPDLPLETQVHASGAVWCFAEGRLTARVAVERQETREVRLMIRAHDVLDPLTEEGEGARGRARMGWQCRVARLHAPGESPLADLTNGATFDFGSLALLEGAEDEWLTPSAGAPIYLSLWARDALTGGWQVGLFDRGETLAHALAFLGRRQGSRVDPVRDEEPGRIAMQVRADPLTRLGYTAFDPYYGDVASPFLFLIGLGYHYALTGEHGVIERHWDEACRVLAWAEEHGDRDGDGYIEYLTRSPDGPSHQGWKDSENAVVDEKGQWVAPPIAPCEIQGYRYTALQFMALLALARGERRRALQWWREASRLKARFNRDFWLEEEGYLAFGLDAEKRPIRALTSNAGQCLATGIVSRRHVPRLVRRLFEPDMFSGWGIRTLSTSNPAYNPLDYHLGTIWPVENATILFGLRRYGMNDRAVELCRALYDLARLWPAGRIPECVGGYARTEAAHPGVYPRANRPQAWNQSAWALIVQSLLGLVAYAPLRLLLVDPVLPPWLPELMLQRLRVGDAVATLRFWRDGRGRAHAQVVECEGELHVVRQPWIESQSTDLWQRMRAFATRMRRR
jgi:glycogen debranching enzyme